MFRHIFVRCNKYLLHGYFNYTNLCISNVPTICRRKWHIYNQKSCFVSLKAFAKDDLDKESTTINVFDYRLNNCAGLKNVLIKLQELLQMDLEDARNLVKCYPKLKKHNVSEISKNFYLYKKEGISIEIMKQYPLILIVEHTEEKLRVVKELNLDLNLVAPLLLAKFNVLRKIVTDLKIEKNVPYESRLMYIGALLKVPVPDVCDKLINHSYVLRIPLDRLTNIINVLLEFGVEKHNILNDFWVLRYSPHVAEERLQKAIEANVSKVKTWMIRCQNKVLDRCISRQIENRKILGSHSSVEDYLSKRLECSMDNAKFLTEKHPALMKMNILKMKEILDFLFEQGFTPTHIYRVPRILIHSLETTKQRLQQLKQYGYTPPSLAILCKSKKDFDKIIKKYIKRLKNSEIQRDK